MNRKRSDSNLVTEENWKTLKIATALPPPQCHKASVALSLARSKGQPVKPFLPTQNGNLWPTESRAAQRGTSQVRYAIP